MIKEARYKNLSVFFICTVFILIFTACSVNEEPLISGERLQAGEIDFTYQSISAEGDIQREGPVREIITKRTDEIVFSMKQNLPRFKVSDSLTMDRKTLAPKHFYNNWENIQSVTVNYSKSGAEVDIERQIETLPDTAYSVSFDTLLYDIHWLQPVMYGLKKQAGDSLSLEGFSFYNERETLNIKVDEEKKTLDNQEFDTWKIVINRKGNITTNFWIEKKINRLLISQNEYPNGNTEWFRRVITN